MKSYILSLVIAAFSVSVFIPTAVAADDPAVKWENDIQTFMEWDSKNSFPSNPVLFVGSSSIRLWKTHESFPELDVINRGFGGSQVSDLLYYYEKLVLKYQPRIIVLYSGDNDIASGKSPQTVANDYRLFIERTHQQLPAVPIIIVPIKPSDARWELWPEMAETNRLVRLMAEADKWVDVVDTDKVIMTPEGRPDTTCFVEDKLHLSDKGYRLWTAVVKQKLEPLLADRPQQK